MGARSYIPIVEAGLGMVVVEIEAIVVAMSITTTNIGRKRLAMGVAEKAIPNGLARSKVQGGK